MVNEYGATLDSNGYAPSLLSDTESCFICGKMGDLVRHEVFHGSNRTKSKELGCWVLLCPKCHDELHTKNPKLDWDLKKKMQWAAVLRYNWSLREFRERFGKSYV